jgi:tetratricopeptide (TPR) repeat protein
LIQRGHALDPDNYLLSSNLGAAEMRQGRVENAIPYYQAAQAALSAHARDYTSPDALSGQMHNYSALLLAQRGALLEALAEQRAARTNGPNTARAFAIVGEYLAPLHEPAAASAALAEYSPAGGLANSASELAALHARLLIATETQDWSAPALERDFAALTARFPGFAEERPSLLDPFLAPALAHTGQFAAAEARLKSMPGDCYPCLRARAQVAALQGQNTRADFWFARAAAIAPSSPYAESEWGRAFLDRKQPDAAIEKFKLSNQKGPHFADPLEGWGEALMAKNQSHLALEKFAEAEKYAPNWGRLHLKWGEALAYYGNKAEAQKHFARAAALDLAPSEKIELAKVSDVRG